MSDVDLRKVIEMVGGEPVVKFVKAEFDESQHPRDESGKFVVSGTLTDKRGRLYEIRHHVRRGKSTYDVAEIGAPEGVNVASAELRADEHAVSSMHTQPEHRGKGIMTALYQHIEQKTGRELSPNRALTAEGRSFWSSYRPAAVPLPLQQEAKMREAA